MDETSGSSSLGALWLWAIWESVHFLLGEMQKHEQQICKTETSQEEFINNLASGHRTARHAGALRVLN